ncbi:MAG: ribosomal protein L7/L12 [Cyanobacteria bacterium J06639_14]
MEMQFQVVIEALPNRHIPALKAIREMLGLGLKESKELLAYVKSSCPCILIAGVDKTVAEDFISRLTRAGVDAKIQESSISNPMLVCPKIDPKCQYHWLFGLQSINE